MTDSTTGSSGGGGSWTERWYGFLGGMGYDLRRGRSLARRMSVRSVDVQVGRVLAELEEIDRGVSRVEIEIVPLHMEAWAAVLDALAGEALHAAQLLAGGTEWETVRSVLDTVFGRAAVELLPSKPAPQEILAACSSCGAAEGSCRHVFVALHLFGQMITDDPWLLLRLRGQDRQQILAGLRRRRSDGDSGRTDAGPALSESALSGPALTGSAMTGPALAGVESMGAKGTTAAAQEGEPSLAVQIDSFWGQRRLAGPAGSQQDLGALHYNINPPLIRLALLRRLGPPPFPQDGMQVYERLARTYLEVSEKALELAYTPQPDADASG